ncbi:MAG: sensor histidine kinase [Lachnospiraceae bacterium]|nr:sensor histidine kinase [Lachnospiraceae bacterium]
MKKSGSVKLQRKILITNIFLFVIPCLLLSLYIVSFIKTEGNRKLNQSKIVILNQINNRLENYLLDGIAYAENIANNFEINKLMSTIEFRDEYEAIQAKRKIQDYMSQNKYHSVSDGYNLEILGENGCFSSEEEGGQTIVSFPDLDKLKEEDWYSLLVDKNYTYYLPVYESTEFSKTDVQSSFRIVRLMKNFNSGRIIGIMDINVRYETLAELLAQGIDSEKQKVFLVNNDGVILGSTDNLMLGEKLTEEQGLSQITEYDHGYFQVNQNAAVTQLNFVTNSTTGWKLVMCEGSQNFVWTQNTSSIYMILVAAIYALIAMVMSIYNSTYISRPVKKLKQDMERVYQGDLSVRSELSNIEEFEGLSLQFNLMLGRIEELIEQLKERDKEKRVLELQALQAQINPHFLYNTLASIRFLIEMDMEEKASESLLALGKLMRKTFSDYRELIPVWEEMENVENYLVLMNNRYQGTFKWNIMLEEEAKECLIPRISIQPLVENSISHGFSGKEDMGHINIEAFIEKEELLILIKDDGVGGDAEKIRNLIQESSEIRSKEQVSGIGVRNVQERLCAFFGRKYGMTAKNAEDGGICVTVHIPVLHENELGIKRGSTGEGYDENCNR